MSDRKLLGKILLEMGAVSVDQVQEAIKRQKESGRMLGDELVSALLLSEQADEAEVRAQRARVEVLVTRIARLVEK